MALFVQIDHFRKTDQKPTVKNHLFSISWFRSFNRTSFQQQLKLHWKSDLRRLLTLQSYILSTTTETGFDSGHFFPFESFNRTSFQQQLKLHRIDSGWIQSVVSFNRTSFQQQLKRVVVFTLPCASLASIVHPFNNNWNNGTWRLSTRISGFNRTSFQQQLKPRTAHDNKMRQIASIVHPFNNNWNLVVVVSCVKRKLQSYILSTTTETSSRLSELHLLLMLQSYILSTTTETPSERTRLS